MIGLVFLSGLFGGMVLLFEAGRRLGVWHRSLDRSPSAGAGTIEAAIFGLLGLLAAFTFSGASTRFDHRRELAVEEANNIGTAYLRLDLLPSTKQPALREEFRQYVDARLAVYRALPDLDAARTHQARATALQGDIWRAAVDATRETPQAAMLLIPALNAMIDVTTERTVAAETHAPLVVVALLVLVTLLCAVLAGYASAGGRTRSWIHILCFTAAVTMTVYVIVDLDHPRWGLIRVDQYDRLLADVRATMG